MLDNHLTQHQVGQQHPFPLPHLDDSSFWVSQGDALVEYETHLPELLPKEIRTEISLFAANGITRIGKHLDAKDKCGLWCVALVTDAREDTKEIRIHYCGWSVRWDEWRSWDNDKRDTLAPLFSKTIPTMDAAGASLRDVVTPDEDHICSDLVRDYPSIGNKGYALSVIMQFPKASWHIAVNALMYKALGAPILPDY
eukprot:TRINITY_DN7908_c0_g1_i2.p1 TRINITY_DN7908_c0_g1~~TRINITY_DN7908_c0_g1_i2.p1  ORF type:complete len:197 (+),score=32.93 TRINITY_DN7908_c0_g1_i2:46-636(+)